MSSCKTDEEKDEARGRNMTKEESKEFEKELVEKISRMTGRLSDKPRYQLSGEIIPESVLIDKNDTTEAEKK